MQSIVSGATGYHFPSGDIGHTKDDAGYQDRDMRRWFFNGSQVRGQSFSMISMLGSDK